MFVFVGISALVVFGIAAAFTVSSAATLRQVQASGEDFITWKALAPVGVAVGAFALGIYLVVIATLIA